LLLLITSLALRANAQSAPEVKQAPRITGQKQQQQPVPAESTSTTPHSSLPISLEQALFLIRSTLLTLNDANHSGNYSVMRDLASPEFQVRNTAADLAQSFADLRRRNFDLYGAALLAPQLTAAPAFDPDKRLHLIGFFPTRPLQIGFNLIYEAVGGQWRLFGIVITTPDAPPVPDTAAQKRSDEKRP
jgi:hypothetical protein